MQSKGCRATERMRFLLRLQAASRQSPARPVQFRIPPKGAGIRKFWSHLPLGLRNSPLGRGRSMAQDFLYETGKLFVKQGGTYDKEI